MNSKNALKLLCAATLLALAGGTSAQEALRPEIGKPLLAAQSLMRKGQFGAALAKVREAQAVPNPTPYEHFMLERMLGSAAAGAGDDALAVQAYTAVLASGQLKPAEQLQMDEALASAEYHRKDYEKAAGWADRYFQGGGNDPRMASLRLSANYLAGNFAAVVRDTQQKVSKIENTPPEADENTLRMLAASYSSLHDDAGYVRTLEKLLLHYPNPAYWADRLARLQNSAGFSDRLTLDFLRLELATGVMSTPAQYVELGELLLSRSLPIEAKRVIDAGFAAKVLGSGPDAPRHARLRAMANKQAAQDENSIDREVVPDRVPAEVNMGDALVSSGRAQRGIGLLQKALATGKVEHPGLASLHIGEALLASGKSQQAIRVFDSIHGDGGMTDLARLWAIYAHHA